MMYENVFPPIPSELIMPLAGYMVTRGQLSFVGIVLAGTLGSVLGALPLYYAGRALGEERVMDWADRHGRWVTVSRKDLERAKRWFAAPRRDGGALLPPHSWGALAHLHPGGDRADARGGVPGLHHRRGGTVDDPASRVGVRLRGRVYRGGTVPRPRLVRCARRHSRTLYRPRDEARGADTPHKARGVIRRVSSQAVCPFASLRQPRLGHKEKPSSWRRSLSILLPNEF